MDNTAVKATLLEIPGNTPHVIYGTHYAARNDKGCKRLIINIHGLTESQWGYLQLNSVTPFTDAGYDVFNFSFYDRLPKSRRLSTSTLSTHQDDLMHVINHFKAEYDSLYLTAHSLGGLVSLILNPKDIKAISFWDPAFDVTHFWNVAQCLTPLKEKDAYILDYGAEYVIGRAMVEEITHYPNAACLALAETFSTPAQLIIPEQSIFMASPHTSPAEYERKFTNGAELITINQTDHCFYGTGKDLALFKNTLNWFNRFS
jgi:hypothetical protein|tara:strand:- start:127460 stop:128236 length:777 start_codon:yes stop_codon:yes gene_type:complete